MSAHVLLLLVLAVCGTAAAMPVQPLLRGPPEWESAAAPTAQYASVFVQSDGTLQIQDGVNTTHAVAYGSFDDSIYENGWSVLRVTTNAAFSDAVQARAAGYLEAYLSADRIGQMIQNYYINMFGSDKESDVPSYVSKFLADNLEWFEQQVQATDHADGDEKAFWAAASLMYAQFKGLVEGYKQYHPAGMDYGTKHLWVLSAQGDVGDLIDFLAPKKTSVSELERGRGGRWRPRTHGSQHIPQDEKNRLTDCSALVKLVDGHKDIFVGHATWWDYYGMLRTWKVYTLAYALPPRGGGDNSTSPFRVSFSSYPGVLISTDDYYQTSRGLVTVETTNDIFNADLFKFVVPKTVLSFARTFIANYLADSGEAWTRLFSLHNSGTYCNQWIVVDMKLFTPNAPLRAGLLWIQEQIPGATTQADMTAHLERTGYWPSYNIPYFTDIFNASGYVEMVAKHGAEYSYDKCARALIFARDHVRVSDAPSMQRIMRYNDYLHDPLSQGDPINAVACRADLVPAPMSSTQTQTTTTDEAIKPVAFGAIDAKVTSYTLVQAGDRTQMVCGPTTSENQLPVFDWRESDRAFDSIAHVGLPERYEFPWLEVQNAAPPTSASTVRRDDTRSFQPR